MGWFVRLFYSADISSNLQSDAMGVATKSLLDQWLFSLLRKLGTGLSEPF
jgi:hypothetical protein